MTHETAGNGAAHRPVEPLRNQMALKVAQNSRATAHVMIIMALTVLALYTGQTIFIPLAMAVILAFALTPAQIFLIRRGIPRVVATIVLVLSVVAAVFAISVVITQQLGSLANDLPRYNYELRQKVRGLKVFGTGGGAVEKATDTLKELGEELKANDKEKVSEPENTVQFPSWTDEGAETTKPPFDVRIVEETTSPLNHLLNVLSTMAGPALMAAFVILFLTFILLEREDFRDRLIRMLGPDDLHRSTVALNDTSKRLSRYLGMLAVLNTAFGIFIGVSLWVIGVPNPALWGLLAAFMRFVPFIGSFISGFFPILLAAAVDPGWSMVAMTFALFAIAEPVMGNVIEPVVQGRISGLSTLAVLIAATFWTLLWGPIGLLLALPLTLVLVSIGRHFEPFAIFSFLLGDQPALSPEENVYHRLLVGDGEDVLHRARQAAAAEDQDEEHDGGLAGFYDNVLRRTLTLVARDHDRNRLDQQEVEDISETIQTVIETLDEETPALADNTSEANARILVMGTKTPIDHSAAVIANALLREQGLATHLVEANNWMELAEQEADIVCIGGFSDRFRLQSCVRRIRKAKPNAVIICGDWQSEGEEEPDTPDETRHERDSIKGTVYVNTFSEMLKAASIAASSADEKLSA